MEGKSCCAPRRSPDLAPARAVPSTKPKTVRFAEEMVPLAGGRFLMGTDDPEGWPSDAEGPIREVEVSPFRLDATAVTNRQFSAFTEETGYRTEAERFGWSYVFILQLPKPWRKKSAQLARSSQAEWWIGMKGARWNCPYGLDSALDGLEDHPVVHISWNDAVEFAHWAGKRLPTEAEWEFAGRGGLVQQRYPWGDELTPGGRHMCNIWQGKFPEVNRPEDGHLWSAPVRSFPPNAYGFYEMSGNVWEWCLDDWSTIWDVSQMAVNPRVLRGSDRKVLRGGSFLCHKSYCNRYRVAARNGNTADSTTSHTGFRCAAESEG